MISSIILLLYLQLSAALQTGQTLELYEANGLTDLSAFLGYGVGTNPAVFISPYGLKSPMSDCLNWTWDRLSEIFVYFNFISISVLLFRRFYLFLVPKPWVVTFRQWYKTFGVHINEDIWKSFNNTMRCMSIINGGYFSLISIMQSGFPEFPRRLVAWCINQNKLDWSSS